MSQLPWLQMNVGKFPVLYTSCLSGLIVGSVIFLLLMSREAGYPCG